jgi:superfamily I DNA/RNA helicase
MVLDSLIIIGFENHIPKIEKKLNIIKHKSNVVKSIFNYRDIVLPYSVIFSLEYGINIFITYNFSLLEIEDNLINIIDSYENFIKVAKQEVSKSIQIKSVSVNFYGYFPKLPHDYFKEDLFNEENDHPSHFIKQVIDKSIAEVKSEQSIYEIVAHNKPSNKNHILSNPDVMMNALAIFTNTTSPDMGTLVLDDKVDHSRVKSMLRRFELDDSQIHKIETQNSENRIILAEAGTGKSVILFAKAQRIAALNPGKKILMLAYNHYLVREMVRKREFESIKESEIDIHTLDKFIAILYDQYIVEKTEIDQFNKSAMISQLNMIIDKLPKYDGIFIDEIQQFESDWLEFLYQLLNSHDKGKYSFVLCGDINQSSSNGKKTPSWKNANLPSFQGRRIKLDKKYRSTESINLFTEELVKNIYTLYARNEMEILYELEGEETYNLELRETETLEDLTKMVFDDVRFFDTQQDPHVFEEIDGNSPRTQDFINFILKIQSEGHDLREFVILYPFQKSYGREYVKDIENALTSNDIYFTSTRTKDENEYITYDEIKSNLAITSIEKCIGLDFKYVIIIGLDTLGTNPRDVKKNTRYESKIFDLDDEIFRRHISQLYVALTRAKTKLFIEIPGNYRDYRSIDDMFRKILLGD